MKKYVYLLAMSLCLGLVACGDDGDDNVVSPGTNNTQQGNTASDPAGTVTIIMGSGISGNYYDIGLEAKIHVDVNNNFGSETVTKEETWYNPSLGSGGVSTYDYYVEFASVGKVGGLGLISYAPTSGWSKSIVVVPGIGYVARMMRRIHNSTSDGYYCGKFTRLYVAEQKTGIGVTIKYQTPFEPPFILEKKSVALSHTWTTSMGNPFSYLTGTTETVKIVNGTRDIKIADQPAWCNVTITNEGNVKISAYKNPDPQPRTGTIVLKNSVCSASIKVTQDVAPPE